MDFNSRPSARGDDEVALMLEQIHHFNSRPSARGDPEEMANIPWEEISIHAPPRGATIPRNTRDFLRTNFNSRPSARGDAVASLETLSISRISIHAPPRGATRYYVEGGKIIYDFNSRPSARGDWTIEPNDERKLISIHAPPRGATCFRGAHPA